MSNHYTVRFAGLDDDPAAVRRRVESIPGLSSEHAEALVAAAEDGEQGGSVTDFPPSAKLVYHVLQDQGEMMQMELAEGTLHSPRTIRCGLNP